MQKEFNAPTPNFVKMKETLESVRNIHQALIIVSSIILIVALNLNRTNPFKDAQAEIADLEHKLESNANLGDIRFIYDDGFEIISKTNLIYLDSVESNLDQKMRNLEIEGVRLKNYYAQRVDTLKRQLQIFQSVRDSAEKNGPKWLMDSIDSHFIPKVTLSLQKSLKQIEKLSQNYDYTPGSIRAALSQKYISDSVTLEDLYENSYYYGDTVLFGKVISVNPEFAFFYSSNKANRIPQVKSLLAEKAENFAVANRGNVDVLGFQVRLENLYLVAPCICIVLELYILALLSHLSSLIKIKQDAEEVRSFPWMPLFSNIYSKFLTAVTFLLPIIATIVLLYRTDVNSDTFERFVEIYGITFTVLGSVIWLYIDHIVKRINCPPLI